MMNSLSALLMGTGSANMNMTNGPMSLDLDSAFGMGSRKTSLPNGAAADGSKSNGEVTYPDWKMELTMERLKQKVAQTRSFTDLSKNVRTAIMERRSILDHNDKSHLQKSLDTLQQNITVNSLQSMVERLEMVSRQQGLRFHPGGTGNEWFISSDMFFLELLISSDGVVQDVKIQHDGKSGQQNCPEIIAALRAQDFADFSAHLAGLVSIYALNADKNIKSKVFIALQALEYDLSTISSTYSPDVMDGDAVVMKSLLGIVKSRTGGHPLRLIFYISPYEFLNAAAGNSYANDVPSILEHKLGTVATVAVQASQSHKLQMSGVVSVVKNEGKSVPRYGALNATNSTALPACFTFNLQQPIAISTQILEKIHAITGIQSIDPSAVTMTAKPLLRLLTEHLLKDAYKNGHTRGRSRGLYVELPDQLHCYYMTEMMGLDAVVLSSIPFTLASQLPPIITLLRQQLAFNTLVGSCIRSTTPSASETPPMVFEVNPLSYQNITVTFQHPLEESLVTLEVDLRDICHPLCKLHAMHPNAGVGVGVGMEIIPTLEEHACRVAARTQSLPVTLRAVIRRWKAIRAAYEPAPPVHEIQTGGGQKSATGAASGQDNKQPSSCRTQSAAAAGATSAHRGSVPTMVTTAKHQPPPRVSSAPAAPISTSTLTISPVTMPTTTVGMAGGVGGMDLMSYMNMTNPLLKSLAQAQFSNMQGLHSLATNPAYQMLASQLAASASGAASPTKAQSQAALLELLDQVRNSSGVGTAGKKRKRKSSSTSGSDSSPVPILPAPTPSQRGHSASAGPKRRMSENNEAGNERVPTPNTLAREMMMSEYGLDSPRHAHTAAWRSAAAHGIDITPVGVGGMGMDSFMAASKLLSAFGAAAAANIKQEPIDHDMVEFMQPKGTKGTSKRQRDHAPKRSMSLDSAHLQTLGALQDAAGRMVPPSLSITPVPVGISSAGTPTTTSAAAQAILAGMKPGIEIIPLHGQGATHITIPNSITVTPIVSKASTTTSSSGQDKKPAFTKKLSTDEFDLLLGKKKKVVEKQRKGSLTEELLKKAGGGGALNLTGVDKKPNIASLASQLSQKTGTPGLLQGLQKKATAGSPLQGKAKGAPVIKTGGVGGKPSFTTLKTTGGSSPSTASSAAKAKPKDKKPGFTLTPSTGSPKPLSKSSSFPAPPTLRPIFDTGNASTGLPSSARSEPSTPTTPTTPGGGLLGSKKGTGFVQTGTVTKKGGLLAGVIDKLKSQASVESGGDAAGGPGGKKELSRIDYLKASSTITTEMQNLQKSKGSSGAGSPAPAGPGGNGNPEYAVKQGGAGGGGLKLTIKTPAPGTTTGKGEKAGGKTPTGVKRPFSPSGPKGSPTSVGGTGAKAIAKKPKIESGSPTPKEQQLDLTKKLFQPGAVRSLEPGGTDAPKFNTSFQIPKKKPLTPPIPIPVAVVSTAEVTISPVKETPTAKEVRTPSPPAPKLSTSPPVLAPITITAVEPPPPALEEMQMDAPASPDPESLSAPGLQEHATTPTIPTTPTAAAASQDPDLPILEHSNNTPTQDTPTSPHEATPPVLELQQNFTIIPEIPTSREEEQPPAVAMLEEAVAAPVEDVQSSEADADTKEMPPPPLPLAPATPTQAQSIASPAATTPSSPAPPLIPSVASPVASVTTTVHIVHSPQPNSPLPAMNVMLRSPLIAVQSPHSVGGGGGIPSGSPFTIDDDLMDEALTGGNGGGNTSSTREGGEGTGDDTN